MLALLVGLASGCQRADHWLAPIDLVYHLATPPSATVRLLNAEQSGAPHVALPLVDGATWPKSAHLGTYDQPAAEAFGEVQDVTIDARGNIYVLDSQAREVRVFAGDGTFAQTIGGPGLGPAELAHPRSIGLASSGRSLAVFDASGRVLIFDLTGDSIRYDATIRFEGAIHDGCAIQERVYIHGVRFGQDEPIHVYRIDGEYLGSFGHSHPTDNRIVKHQLARGHVVCLEQSNLVLHAPELVPHVQAYDADGKFAWWVAIDGFIPMELSVTAQGGSRLRIPDTGADHVVSVVGATGGDAVALQFARVTPANRRDRVNRGQLQTLVLSIEGPTGIELGGRFDRVFHWGERVLVVGRFDPYPVVSVFAKWQ